MKFPVLEIIQEESGMQRAWTKEMGVAERREVSERMKKFWDERRKRQAF